ncbi:MAG TPA: FMN-binding protein [Pseudonocardiaceae bacterium]|jgi:uncharacterized protein with FMN-binding domain
MSSTRSRRVRGLSALLAGIGLLVAAKAAIDQTAPPPLALPPATPPSAPSGSDPTSTGTPEPHPSTSTSPAGTGPHTVDGAVVPTPYGPVQVAVRFDHGRIVDVHALRTPSAAERSVRLAALATPVLRSEVLATQSARVDSVSGATYTSEGYAQSVQYALDHRAG